MEKVYNKKKKKKMDQTSTTTGIYLIFEITTTEIHRDRTFNELRDARTLHLQLHFILRI